MTYIQYYIAQFKELPICWRLCVLTRHRAYFFEELLFLFNPPTIYIMYLYDTGKLKPDARYMTKDGGKQTEAHGND